MLLPKQNLQPAKTESLFAPQNRGERGYVEVVEGGSGIAIVNKLSTYKVDFVINIFAYCNRFC